MDNTQDRLIEVLQGVLNQHNQKDTFAEFQDMFAVSQYLNGHPVKSESIDYKIRYLNVLEYFVKSYAADSLYAAAALHNYKDCLLGVDFQSYDYTCKDINSCIKRVARTRFKGFKLCSNRFILVMDIIFLCAFDDAGKGHSIFCQIKNIYHNRYRETLDNLYKVLYEKFSITSKLQAVSPQISLWHENRNYLKRPLHTTLFVANMNAGKSTLINALIGKKINRSMSQACTAKLHYIFSKAFEDGYVYEYDYLLNLNADYESLMTDNPQNTSNRITVGTAFKLTAPSETRACFVDTPGANFSMDNSHGEICHRAVSEKKYDTLVYVFSAGTTGINDEFEYLNYIKEKGRKRCRLIFLLNKLDEYNSNEDSVDDSLQKLNADLQKIGFENYQLYPVSAYAGHLAKRVISGEEIEPCTPEFFKLMRCKAHFNNPLFDFSKYYDTPASAIEDARKHCLEHPEEFDLLLKSGIWGLEYILTH
ncbi:dynamin family protein [Agathobaculum sp. Marseille-P7918]|uniref:dynamin family protein n=1 Tax=Agathobaculum sp. Marseille-P7918 TaxID=2479843 RepID=UPI000F641549|nr:dynamin family protein [Agathobaculum sp. Marseille-P7918]